MNGKDKTMVRKNTRKAKQETIPAKKEEAAMVPQEPLTQRELTRINSYRQKVNTEMEAPSFVVSHANGKVNLHPNYENDVAELLHYVGMAECFGTGSQKLNHSLLNQLLSLVDTRELSTDTINAELALMHNIKPQDALETMLVIQMIATHKTMLIYSGKLLQKGSYSLEQVNSYLNAITKLSRTYTT